MSSGIDGSYLTIYVYLYMYVNVVVCIFCSVIVCGMSLSSWDCDTAVTMSTFNLTKFSYGAKSNYNIVFRAPFYFISAFVVVTLSPIVVGLIGVFVVVVVVV